MDIIKSALEQNLGFFFNQLDPDTMKLGRKLQKKQNKIIKNEHCAVFN